MSKRHDTLPFDTIHLEGALFVPDLLEKVTRGEHTGQGEKDYLIPKGLKLHDEYGRAFQIAIAQWKIFAQTFSRQDIDAVSTTRNYVQELLQDVLGYVLDPGKTIAIADRLYHLAFLAFGRVPIFVAPSNLSLDDVSTLFNIEGSGSRKRSVFRLAQEFLNASPACTWAVVTNGRRVRLLRDSTTLTRPCFLEFDLETILAGNRYPDFAALWRTLHGSRAGVVGTADTSCIWEQWRTEGQAQGTRVREGLRFGVTRALVALGNGFLNHPANDALHARLQDGSLTSDQLFQEMLRLVYRFLFLFTLEERKDEQTEIPLLHPPDTSVEAQLARSVYNDGYSLKRLRNRVLRSIGHDRYDDLWQGLAIVFRSLYQGEPRLALPALGGLFSPDQCPTLDSSALNNRVLLETIYYLRWAQIDGAIAPVDYSNMGPEELGSVYESLLELVPVVNLPAREFGFVGITEEGNTSGHARKTTGSYYTPDSLVQELIKSALDPVIEARLAARPDNPTEALLAITVIDPACGSGHFLLAAARRLAEHLAELRSVDGAMRPEDYRHALREVIGHCIFGVDRNPMALELARTALWLEGFESGKPLSFLNHHLVCGDALLGLMDFKQLASGIPKEAYKLLSGDDPEVCRSLAQTNRDSLRPWQSRQKQGYLFPQAEIQEGWQRFTAVERLPEGTVAEIEAKAKAYTTFLAATETSSLRHAADCFVGAFLSPKTSESTAIPTTANLLVELFADPADENHPLCLKTARQVCIDNRVLHWPLVFPQIAGKGGFDCVLANPPWERIKLQEEEFFATRNQQVAAARNKAERGQRITWLAQGMLSVHLSPELGHDERICETEKRTYREFIVARRGAEAASLFAHLKEGDGGRYPLTGVGDVNTYALFAETINHLIAPDGRAGFIVPTGIATDDSTKAFFSEIVQHEKLIGLYSFENEEFLFKSVHHSFRFCLMVLGKLNHEQSTDFVFFARQPGQLADLNRHFSLTKTDIAILNPNTETCPIFRSQMDAELTRKIYSRVPVLIREARGKGKDFKPDENPWGIQFQAMFHMSNDSHLFAFENRQKHLPLYEAKMIHQFDHRWASYHQGEDGAVSTTDVPLADKQHPGFTVTPRYWVDQREVFLRVAKLPKGMLKALQERDTEAIILSTAHLLFGQWLHRQGMSIAVTAMAKLYPSWQEFVRLHPFFAEIAPTQLGLCGKSEAGMIVTGPNCLPARPIAKVVTNRDTRTAWYAADQNAVETYLAFVTSYPWVIDSTPSLTNSDAVLSYTEQLLEAASPKWLIGWRDITSAHVLRTVIASVLPLTAVGNKIPLIFINHTIPFNMAAALLGNLSALCLDFAARQKIGGTTLNFFIIKQLPILSPESYSEADLAFIVPRVLELTYTSYDLQAWAEDLGYTAPPFPYNPERRSQLRAELDAYYARLYGLTRDELRYILDPTDIMGEDYPSETFRVLKNNELRNFGEYRTQQLVLEAWDKLATTTYSVDNQLTYHEDPQIFPWPGRERFIYNLIPHLVHAKVGMQFEYYRDAALLASRPEYLRQLLSPQNIDSFDALPQDIKNACTFPTEHHVRPRQLRKRLTANGQIDIDAANGSTQLGAAVDVPQTLPGMDHLIPFILEAADNLRQHQERTIEVLDSKERETVIQAVQFLQAAVGWT